MRFLFYRRQNRGKGGQAGWLAFRVGISLAGMRGMMWWESKIIIRQERWWAAVVKTLNFFFFFGNKRTRISHAENRGQERDTEYL